MTVCCEKLNVGPHDLQPLTIPVIVMLYGKREIIQVGLICLYELFKSEEEGREEVRDIQSRRTQFLALKMKEGGYKPGTVGSL